MTEKKPRDELRDSLTTVKWLFGLFAVAMIAMIASLYVDAEDRNDDLVEVERLVDEVHRIGEQNCEGLQANREVLRSVVSSAYTGENRDLAQIDGFAEMPESVQRFLLNIISGGTSTIEQRDALLALIPDVAC